MNVVAEIVGGQSAFKTGINAVGIVAEYVQAAAEISYESSPSSSKLAENLIAAGFERPSETAAHHIVAGSSPAAAEAREILKTFGIGINDAENGVFLPASTKSSNQTGAAVHSTVHTTEYYKTVTEALSTAQSKSEAIGILGQIRDDLLSGGL